MIIGSLETLQRTPLPEPLGQIMAQLQAKLADWDDVPLGKHEIDSDRLFYLVNEEVSEPFTVRRGEFHQQYLDIQLLLSGQEWIGVGPHQYDARLADHPHPDLWFVDTPQTSYIALQPLDFAIFWPGELHRPLCTLQQSSKLKKLVVKVHVSLLMP